MFRARLFCRFNITRAHMVQLCDALQALGFTFIILDCPAGIDVGFINAISPAKEAVLITTPEITSIRQAEACACVHVCSRCQPVLSACTQCAWRACTAAPTPPHLPVSLPLGWHLACTAGCVTHLMLHPSATSWQLRGEGGREGAAELQPLSSM